MMLQVVGDVLREAVDSLGMRPSRLKPTTTSPPTKVTTKKTWTVLQRNYKLSSKP